MRLINPSKTAHHVLIPDYNLSAYDLKASTLRIYLDANARLRP